MPRELTLAAASLALLVAGCDPEVGCWIDTWFEGQLHYDTLGGMYFSRRLDGDSIRMGTWWVARQR